MIRIVRVAVVAMAVMSFAAVAFADGPFQYYPLTPCRIADTRLPNGTNQGPILGTAVTRDFQVRGLCGVPSTAKAASLNFTIANSTVPSGQPSWLTVWPSGSSMPATSIINFSPGDPPTANGAITPLSTNTLDLSVQNARGTVHVIIDVTGYFQ